MDAARLKALTHTLIYPTGCQAPLVEMDAARLKALTPLAQHIICRKYHVEMDVSPFKGIDTG